jgi:hypothetical protein
MDFANRPLSDEELELVSGASFAVTMPGALTGAQLAQLTSSPIWHGPVGPKGPIHPFDPVGLSVA